MGALEGVHHLDDNPICDIASDILRARHQHCSKSPQSRQRAAHLSKPPTQPQHKHAPSIPIRTVANAADYIASPSLTLHH